MAVPNQVPLTVHTGNGVTTAFSYQFLLLLSEDAKVMVDGVVLTNGVAYVVDGLRNPAGGTITFVSPPIAGARIALGRSVVLARNTDYQYSGDFQSNTVNTDFDRLWMATQDTAKAAANAVVVPPDEDAPQVLPAALLRRAKLLAFDALNGDAMVSDFTFDQVANAIAAAYVAGTTLDALSFIQNFTGAVPQTGQAKLRQAVTVRDAGVVADGVTDDRAKIVAVLGSGQSVDGLDLTSKINGTLQLPGGAPRTLRRFNLVDNGVNAALFVSVADGSTGISIDEGSIQSLDGTAVSDATTNASLFAIRNARIIGASYAFLSNEPTGGTNASKGYRIRDTYLYSDRADAVEFNHFNAVASDFSVDGCTLETGNGSAFVGSGFGFGVAGTNGWRLANTVIRYSRSEAVHVEDSQKHGKVSNVAVLATIDHGMVLLQTASSTDPAHGVQVSNFSVTHTGAKTGFYGINVVNDASGSLQANQLSNIRVEGFERGFEVGGNGQLQMINNAYAKDCDFAFSITGAAKAIGSVVMSGTGAMARASNSTRVPFIAAKDTPSSLMTFTGGATQAGAVQEGFLAPFPFAHGGTGTEVVPLPGLTLPNMMEAKVSVVLASATNFFRVSADLLWEGTTLTVSNLNRRHNGSFANATFVNSGGVLAIQVSSAVAVTTTASVKVDGELYYR